nr:hypothetical protein Iba_scaffold29754CG0030 [Ipomoea batatas]
MESMMHLHSRKQILGLPWDQEQLLQRVLQIWFWQMTILPQLLRLLLRGGLYITTQGNSSDT